MLGRVGCCWAGFDAAGQGLMMLCTCGALFTP